MTEDQIKKLRSYYHSLMGNQQVLDEAGAAKHRIIRDIQFRVLAGELYRLEADFPGFLPPFRPGHLLPFEDKDFFQGSNNELGDTYYDLAALRAYLATVLGRLKTAIDIPENTPVTEVRAFAFVKNAELRVILERDYQEIQRAYIAECWKSVIILAGSAIEAILTDLLLQHQSEAIAAPKAPKGADITRWDLADLINVSVELRVVSSSVERLSHSVRGYRNLVHPGNEIRNKLTFDAEEAKIALEVLHIIHRDLSK